jgi:low temperature requirement protein LtrA
VPAIEDSIWQRPVLRGGTGGHRQATWAELFFDLIFVVAVAQLATLLLENVSWRGAMIYVFAYVPVWFSWIAATLYSNRFDTDDLSQRLITFAQMLTVAGMAASVAESAAIPFAISIGLFRLLTVGSYMRVRWSLPGARPFANRMIVVMAASSLIWFASVFFEGDTRLVIWAAAIVLELGVGLTRSTRRRMTAVPIHFNHLIERFGLFTIIVLGETVLAVVVGVAHAHWVASAVIFAAIGLTMSFSLWWIYFEVVTGEPLRRIGGFWPFVWAYSHAPFVIAITALGVGIEIAVFTEFGHQLETAQAVVLTLSLAVALVAIAVILASETSTNLRVPTVLKRLPSVLLVLVIGMAPISAQAVIVGLSLVTGTQAVVDVRARLRASAASQETDS